MSQSIRIQVRAFARYAELLGGELFSLELTHPATVQDAIATLRAQVPGADQLPARPMVAINLQHVLADHPVSTGDELALLPPLAGG